jgi:hypothetical protein
MYKVFHSNRTLPELYITIINQIHDYLVNNLPIINHSLISFNFAFLERNINFIHIKNSQIILNHDVQDNGTVINLFVPRDQWVFSLSNP